MLWFCSFVIFAVFHVSLATSSGITSRKLNDGHEIPTVALGTYRYTSPANQSIDAVRQAVVWAIQAGFRHIDTSTYYGDEAQVGQGVAEAVNQGLVTRGEMFVTTKLINYEHGRDQVVPALKESLKKLQLDYVDLYLIHFPTATKEDYKTPLDIDYLETWSGMEEAQSLGLARSIGLANFNNTQIARIIANSKVVPAVNQIEVNPTATQEPIVSYCQDQGIQVMAYAPFGFAVPRKGYENVTQPPPQLDDLVMQNLAKKYGKCPAQILIRYLIDRGTIPIPKSTNEAHIFENIDVFDFNLSDEDVAMLSSYNRNQRVYAPTYLLIKDHPYYPFIPY